MQAEGMIIGRNNVEQRKDFSEGNVFQKCYRLSESKWSYVKIVSGKMTCDNCQIVATVVLCPALLLYIYMYN